VTTARLSSVWHVSPPALSGQMHVTLPANTDGRQRPEDTRRSEGLHRTVTRSQRSSDASEPRTSRGISGLECESWGSEQASKSMLRSGKAFSKHTYFGAKSEWGIKGGPVCCSGPYVLTRSKTPPFKHVAEGSKVTVKGHASSGLLHADAETTARKSARQNTSMRSHNGSQKKQRISVDGNRGKPHRGEGTHTWKVWTALQEGRHQAGHNTRGSHVVKYNAAEEAIGERRALARRQRCNRGTQTTQPAARVSKRDTNRFEL
jgi:hypothetical protein